MVSYEAGQILNSGFDVSDLFSVKERFGNYKVKEFLKDAALPENSPGKKNPNIKIIHSTGPQEIDDFCAEINKHARKYNKLIDRLGDRWQQVKLRAEIRDNIIKINEKKDKNWGDNAIIALIEKNCGGGNKKPVFLLSDDVGLMERTNTVSNTNTVTVSVLIYALSQAGLGKNVGFPSSYSAGELERQRRSNDGNPHFEKINNEDYNVYVKKNPFAQSLVQLKQDMDKEKSQVMESYISRLKSRFSGEARGLQR
jgi:hypothetical protein